MSRNQRGQSAGVQVFDCNGYNGLTKFFGIADINFANEKYRFGNLIDLPAANSGEGLAVVDLRTTRLAGIEFMLRVALHPTLTKGGRYRIESDSSIRIPITKNFMWGLSLYDRFDSQPPVPVDRNDYGLISTLGYKF